MLILRHFSLHAAMTNDIKGMTKGMANHHYGVLSQKEMIHVMSLGGVAMWTDEDNAEIPTTWIITTKGSMYLVERRLVS